ncbi:hypothetical protein [Streptomyces benahoarensis]|uniref:Uncharacterized protein n=1 Tax=Streptomyces benahoarensis TaxID=2595054 RepID=A0A553ZJK2_9ACTN|nr:hypothetical protein [Streptomyces benahoarensis]TSB21872.1 hypothetical protein FNJ62_17255 [Streptomyces benahoarensis]TSB41567.1 hypothetical protein FNZ23_12460 [Streptomyces benahoarensis]
MPANDPELPAQNQPAPPSEPPAPQPAETPLLSQHAFTVLLGAAAIGVAAGCVTFAQSHSPAGAVAAGGAAFLLSVPALHKLIG